MTQATIENVTVGTRLRADTGFTCLDDMALVIVCADHDGDLYVPCRDGAHYLEGQLDDDWWGYVGFTIAEEAA